MLMREVDYLFVQTGVDGAKHAVNYQLPGEGTKLIYNASRAVRAHLTPDKWAEVKISALEVSATGQAKKIWIDGRHYVFITLADQRPL